jgi:hypothetical protein
VDLECGGIMLRDEFESVVRGLEEVRALEELGTPLVPRLEDDLEKLVDRLFGRRRPDDREQLGFTRRNARPRSLTTRSLPADRGL